MEVKKITIKDIHKVGELASIKFCYGSCPVKIEYGLLNGHEHIYFISSDNKIVKDWNFDNVKKEFRYFFTENEMDDRFIDLFTTLVNNYSREIYNRLVSIETELGLDIDYNYNIKNNFAKKT